MTTTQSRNLFNALTVGGLIMTVLATIYLYQLGIFKDPQALQAMLGNSPFLAPFIFIAIQIIQVIIPIIPGGISTAAGVIAFGPVQGFIYNYVGIVIGSLIIFLLGRHYGKPFVHNMVSDKVFNKYGKWMEDEKRFTKLFALAIFLPIAPDDALCLLASLTNISFKKYTAIIILAKPFAILAYSFALVHGWSFITNLLG